MSARAIRSGTATISVLSIPFKLYAAALSSRLRFNWLHKKCSGRMKGAAPNALCPVDNVIVEREDMVRGYEFARDQYVQFTEAELVALSAAPHRDLEILEFVPAESIDAALVARTYYMGPAFDAGAERAYALLARVLREKGRAAIGRYHVGGRDELVALRPHREGLVLQVLHHASEVQPFEDLGLGAPSFREAELESARELVDRFTSPAFEHAKYSDAREDRLRDAVEKKIAAREVTVLEEPPKAQIIDLFEALKRSLATAPPPLRRDSEEA